MMLERARLAESQGDGATALTYYALIVEAWRGADPELQPVVAEARAGVTRLGARSAR